MQNKIFVVVLQVQRESKQPHGADTEDHEKTQNNYKEMEADHKDMPNDFSKT